MFAATIPMALVYDFDGTLAPGNMQERQFIPNIGMTPTEFWNEVNDLAGDNEADLILMYMYVMLEKARAARVSVRRESFKERSRGIRFFDGVEEWFQRVNAYGARQDVAVEHYLISSGNAEIIEGTSIAPQFSQIYASRFLFDPNDVAVWPAQAINFTTKTQYLFRINKGAHDLSDDSLINKFVAQEERPVPFENMVYIGDGQTDVPCFRLVKDLGGLSVAVYDPALLTGRQYAETYRADGRVNAVAPADYTEGGELDLLVQHNIDFLAARARLRHQLAPPDGRRP